MAGRRKGRESRAEKAQVDDDGTGLVPVELNEHQKKERGEELVSWLAKKHQLEDKKKEQVKKINAELKLTGDKVRTLTRELDTGIAYVDPQLALDYANAGSSNDSQRAVAAS